MTKRIAFAFSLLAAPFLAHAQTTPVTCTAATLSGTYALALSGRDVSPAVIFTQTYQAAGTATFDGVGAVTATLMTNTNLLAGAPQMLSGTYTLPTNCVGTINITTGDTASFTLIPYNAGKNFTITGQDATFQFSGSGSPLPVACMTSTLSGVYAFNGAGFALTSAAITGVNNISGLLQFDGAGTITGNWSISTNGSAVADTISGKYTLSAGCVGSATVTDPGGVAYTLSYVVTSADGANLTVLGSTPTNTFTGAAHSTFTNPGLAVANAAGISGGTPAGSLFTIYGVNLASGQAQPTNVPLPTTLATASVTVNGELAPLTYVDKGQINAQMPLDVQPGVATVVVKTGTTLSNAVAALVPATAVPGVFIYGANRAVAQNFPKYDLNTPSSPAPIGSTIIVYFTGGGPVQGGSALITGHATPNAAFPVMETTSATVAGVPAILSYVGLTPGFVGLYQANLIVPKVGTGDRSMTINIGGTNSNSTLIAVK